MATFYTKKGGGYGIKFTIEGKRKELTLGAKFSNKTATKLKEIIETLIACRDNNQIPDKQVFAYLEIASPEIRAKLEKVGLISQSKIRTCGELWNAFEADDRGIKESTKRNYQTVRKRFFMFFKESDPIEKLTKESLLNWKKFLVSKKYAVASTSNAIAKTKCVLNWATNEKDLFAKSPGTGVKKGSCVNKDRVFFITMVDYEKILAACRTPEQRAILALARIGGLRIPSEIANLTWADILWDIGKIWIKSPKTEHYEGKKGRFVPLWGPIRKELEALFFTEEADGKDDRVFRNRNVRSNLRTRFEKIQIRAGIVPIVKFFTNCRASRSTEVYEKYGAIKESLWIGHSQAVARRHYHQVPDDDFRAALLENFELKSPSIPNGENDDTFSRSKLESPVFCSVRGQNFDDTFDDTLVRK